MAGRGDCFASTCYVYSVVWMMLTCRLFFPLVWVGGLLCLGGGHVTARWGKASQSLFGFFIWREGVMKALSTQDLRESDTAAREEPLIHSVLFLSLLDSLL